MLFCLATQTDLPQKMATIGEAMLATQRMCHNAVADVILYLWPISLSSLSLLLAQLKLPTETFVLKVHGHTKNSLLTYKSCNFHHIL